jgi:tryptophan synthase alpha chain
MNRLQKIFVKKEHPKLNIYFTAGHPTPDSTADLVYFLEKYGADIVEIGMPYSDPLADGPTIQESSKIALAGGMSMEKLFAQLTNIRERVSIPLILMGYFNPVLQFGVENFCREAARVGIDGLILPDLPLDFFEKNYRPVFEKYGLKNILLVTPQTSETRIRQIDAASASFIYVVASAATTGGQTGISSTQISYFQRLLDMNLRNPLLAGFGISDRNDFETVGSYLDGAIVGSAFIKALSNEKMPIEKCVKNFVEKLKPAELSPV